MEFSPSVLLLVLYPVVGLAAPLVFFSLWPKKLPPAPNLAVGDEDKKAANARLARKIRDFRNTEGLAMVQIRYLGGLETKNEAFA